MDFFSSSDDKTEDKRCVYYRLNQGKRKQMSKYFFITLDTYEENWYGHLTIGQPCYLWSSADVGDAHLIDTDSCKTLEHAIATLKGDIGSLLRAFSTL